MLSRIYRSHLRVSMRPLGSRAFTGTSVAHSPIDLEMLDVDLFRSVSLWKPMGARAVYGGQVVGQAVAASARCVTDKKALHSLHSYFLKGGNPEIPILYHVQRLSVTNNFENHNIIAKQQGQVIFSCTASYHRPEASTLFHERPMPTAPDPETLMNQEDRLEEVLADPRLPDGRKQRILKALETPFPIDCRVVNPDCFFNPSKQIPRKLVWMKARIPLSDAEPNMHRCVAAFNSDWGLCSTSLLPHGLTVGSPELKIVTSLDHAMWFHAGFRADEWMLFDMHR
mmetsp:Transcript_29179/g.49265  ORF Transcript_29179/g.49265 Transcript_29179/m.49265 type:complete len:283 (+) Transcript_29179:47-895(+)